MDAKSNPKFPSESTVAQETEDAIKSPSCQIWVQDGVTTPSNAVTRIQMEWFYSPYQSQEIDEQVTLASKVQGPGAICCIVYIRSFTNSGHDFVYCVPELTNLPKFYGGTYGGRNYEGPILATLVVLCRTVLENVGPIEWKQYTKVPKDGGKFNDLRWRYLFATAGQAWSKMRFYAWGLPVLQSMVADAPAQQQESEAEDTLPGPISLSSYSPEARRIAIHQNVELLKKKRDHHDKVFEYLEIELSGLGNRQGRDKLTQQQYRLLEWLRDNADDLQTLYDDDDPDEAKINKEFFLEQEAHLISQRDDIIRQIEEQLALPTTSHDDSEDSDLPELEPPGTPTDSQQDAEAIVLGDSGEPMDTERPTTEQAKVIEEFANFTGAQPYQSEGYLFSANWDLELALSYFYEDQPATNSSFPLNTDASTSAERPDVSASISKQRLSDLTTFQGLTNADSTIAEKYLVRAYWDVGTAVSAFFDDKDNVKGHSVSTDESVNAIASDFSAKIRERPVEDRSIVRGRAPKRLARDPVDLGADLKTDIRNRIKVLEAKIRGLDKVIDKTNDDGLDVIMQDVMGSETDSDTDRETQAASGSKPHTTDESEHVPQWATYHRGLSHAGLRLVLDEAGNVVSYSRPVGTPYQQYCAMRLRLQVQNYGHEVIPSDEDPHRGIPTRERYPAPLVQEVEEEVEESDDRSSVASKDQTLPSWQESVFRTKQASMKRETELELANLIEVLADAETAETAQSKEIAGTPERGIQVDDQQLSDWAKQAMQAIQRAALSARTERRESDETKRAPIKTVLKRPSHPRRLTMKVRFNLGDGPDLPTTWDDRVPKVEEKTPDITMAMPELAANAEILAAKVSSDSTENEQDTTSSRTDHPSEPMCDEEVQESKETLDTRSAGDENGDSDVDRKKNLFISKQEDNWDGMNSDEGEFEPKLESESDVDAEGEEEEEIQEQQQENIRRQCEEGKCPPRVDEKMED